MCVCSQLAVFVWSLCIIMRAGRILNIRLRITTTTTTAGGSQRKRTATNSSPTCHPAHHCRALLHAAAHLDLGRRHRHRAATIKPLLLRAATCSQKPAPSVPCCRGMCAMRLIESNGQTCSVCACAVRIYTFSLESQTMATTTQEADIIRMEWRLGESLQRLRRVVGVGIF